MDECKYRKTREDGNFVFCKKRGSSCVEFLNQDCDIKFGTEIIVDEEINLRDRFKSLTIKTFEKIDEILEHDLKSRDIVNLGTGLKCLYDITGLEEDEQLTDKEITKEEIKKIQQILGRSKKKKN
jgi:hypothetical protein